MPRTAKIEIFEDPGHGWARVLRTRVQKLGIADKISSYSYQRGKYVFLEEDCDLTVLCNALRDQGVTEFKFTTHHTDRQSKIRNYDYYKA
jgi:hypothetical protein